VFRITKNKKKNNLEEEDMSKRFLVLIALLMLGFFVAGCADGDKSASVVNPNPDVFSPVGSISGVVYDYCTDVPIKGAVVSVAYAGAVHQVTTSANGAYSFNNVPAMYGDSFYGAGYGGAYTVSCDLTKVTGYGYALNNSVSVYYSTLNDGTNYDLGYESGNDVVEGGSGANTPVNHLAATLDFAPGPLTSSIAGTIYDVSTGRAVSGAVVSLYYGSMYRASVTSTDGTYSFANTFPGSYSLMVTKAGYEYAALQAANTVGSPSCNIVPVSCAIGCGQAKAGINVNMIANPAKDKTIPYIVSAAAGTEADVIDGDIFPSLEQDAITTLVFNFSEGMQASRSLKGNAVTLAATAAVTVTSGGVGATLEHVYPAGTTIISDYTVTMTSAGVMTITPTFRTAADWATLAGYGATATFTYESAATYTVTFATSPHLTDLSFVPWAVGDSTDEPGEIGTTAGVDLGYLHAFGEAYQDFFILGIGTSNISISVGE
jgi:hypothetical protein